MSFPVKIVPQKSANGQVRYEVTDTDGQVYVFEKDSFMLDAIEAIFTRAPGNTFKYPADFTTTGNITLSGLASQANGDWQPGTLTAGQRVLVKNQSTGANNGIYVAAAGAWTRAEDWDESSEVFSGAQVFIDQGTTLADTIWALTTPNPIVVGTTALTFAKVGSASNPIFYDTTAWVDTVNGSDVSAVIGRFDLPYKTVQAAVTAQTAGNPVFVRAGTYDESVTLKNNVSVWAERGVTFTRTGSGTTATIVYPAVAGENYDLLGYAVITANSSGSNQACISGGANRTGAGRMRLECVTISGMNANNRVLDLADICGNDPTNVSTLKFLRATGLNTSQATLSFVYNGGAGAIIDFNSITNSSAGAGAPCLSSTGSNPAGGSATLIIQGNEILSTGANPTGTLVNFNYGAVSNIVIANIGSISHAGNGKALIVCPGVTVNARIIRNFGNTATVDSQGATPTGGGVPTINGAQIINTSNAAGSPLLDLSGSCIIFNECYWYNSNFTTASFCIRVQNSANTLAIFNDCDFHLAGTDVNGLIQIENVDKACFKGTNTIIRRAGTAPSIGSTGANAIRMLGIVTSPVDMKAGMTTTGAGGFTSDPALTISNCMTFQSVF